MILAISKLSKSAMILGTEHYSYSRNQSMGVPDFSFSMTLLTHPWFIIGRDKTFFYCAKRHPQTLLSQTQAPHSAHRSKKVVLFQLSLFEGVCMGGGGNA